MSLSKGVEDTILSKLAMMLAGNSIQMELSVPTVAAILLSRVYGLHAREKRCQRQDVAEAIQLSFKLLSESFNATFQYTDRILQGSELLRTTTTPTAARGNAV